MKLFLSLFIVFQIVFVTHGEGADLSDPKIIGDTECEVGVEYTYSITSDDFYFAPNWVVTGGSVISTDMVADGNSIRYEVVIEWIDFGNKNIQFKEGGSILISEFSFVLSEPETTLDPGSIGTSNTICILTSAGTITNTSSASGGIGSYTYLWQYKVPGGTWFDVTENTNNKKYYSPGVLGDTRKYRRRVTSGTQTKYSNVVTITVADLTPGSIEGAHNVCYDGNPSKLNNSSSAGNNKGTINYQWQYSNNGNSGWNNIGEAKSTSYNPPSGLTSNRWYRRRAKDNCQTVFSNIVKVTVKDLTPGAILGEQSICYNEDPASLTSNFQAGNNKGTLHYQWQFSANGNNGWDDITGAASAFYDPPSGLTADRWYRRRAQDNCQTEFTNSVKITVKSLNPGSLISANQTICKNTSPGSLSVESPSGYTGDVSYQWESKTNSIDWEMGQILGADRSYYVPNDLTEDTWFRRKVSDDYCVAYSDEIFISIGGDLKPGTIKGAQSVSYNGNPAKLDNSTPASAYVGDINYQWQVTESDISGWANINGANNSTYNPPSGHTVDRWYQRLATDNCTTKPSNIVKVALESSSFEVESFVGETMGDDFVFNGESATIAVSDYHSDAQIVGWQRSSMEPHISRISENTSTITVTALLVESSYRPALNVNWEVQYGAWQEVPIGKSTSISLLPDEAGYDVYYWQKITERPSITDISKTTDAITETPVLGQNSYRPVFLNQGDTLYGAWHEVMAVSLESKDVLQENYVVSEVPLVDEITDRSEINTDNGLLSVSFMDGFGRARQTVYKEASPTGKDIVSFAEFNEYGDQVKEYLPYTASTTSLLDIHEDTHAAQAAFYSETANVASDSQPYSEIIREASPLGRVLKSGSAGAAWDVNGNHKVTYDYQFNQANEIRMWESDGTSNGFYGVNTLFKNTVTDEDGNKRIVYTDRSGKTIAKKVEVDAGQYLTTYIIYDDFGRVKYVVPPLALKKMDDANSYTISSVAELIFSFTYDKWGRLIEKQVPGTTAPEAYVYNTRDELILYQSALLAQDGKWLFTKYDKQHRTAYTGLYESSQTRSELQTTADAQTNLYESRSTDVATKGYTNQAFPTANLTVLSANYYDDYALIGDVASGFAFDPSHLTGQETSADDYTTHKLTASTSRILETDDWLTQIFYYNEDGQVIQILSNNHMNLDLEDKTTMIYDYQGKVVQSLRGTHDGNEIIHTGNRMEYDLLGRVLAVYHEIGGVEQQIASYTYNELGQVIEKNIHEEAGNYLQSIDFDYNIRGWLEGINNVNLDESEAAAGSDLFGMQMHYNQGATNNKYNGNIGAIRWNTAGEDAISKYNYTYDRANRLTAADWKKGVDVGDFDMTATYDVNGNITSLNRNALDSILTSIDELTYAYSGNQLQGVEDASDNPLGFEDGSTASEEYTYDANGNMTQDLNKGITEIIYNHLNKPTLLTISNKEGTADSIRIAYTYSAGGQKLKVQNYNQNDELIKTTSYLGGAVYEDDVLQYIQHSEGRIVYHEETLDGSNYEYQYQLTDHLGNVRMMLTTAERTTATIATMEESQAQREDEIYFNYENANIIHSDMFDHTNSASDTTRNAMLLYGIDDVNIGLVRILKVMPGDEINMSVFAKYYQTEGTDDLSALVSTIGAQLLTGSALLPEGSSLNPSTPWADPGRSGVDNTVPEAYLNYMVFDKHRGLIAEKTGFQQISSDAKETGANTQHEELSHSITIEEAGFVYIYLSNESEQGVDVFFDDFWVEQVHGPIIQTNDYYPFGLQTAASMSQDFITPNKRLYNAGSELNEQTQNFETFYRHYDPALGRFNGVDIKATSFADMTPYQYAFDNPVNYNDPLGDRPYWASMERGRTGSGPLKPAGSRSYGSEGGTTRGSTHAGSGGHWSDNGILSGATQMLRDYFLSSGSSFDKRYGKADSDQRASFASSLGSTYKYIKSYSLDYTTENLNGEIWTGATVIIENKLVEVQSNGSGWRDFMHSWHANMLGFSNDVNKAWGNFRSKYGGGGGIVSFGNAGVGWALQWGDRKVQKAEFMDTKMGSIAPNISANNMVKVPSDIATIILNTFPVIDFGNDIGDELYKFMNSPAPIKIDTARIAGPTTYERGNGFRDAYGPAVIRQNGIPQDTIQLIFK